MEYTIQFTMNQYSDGSGKPSNLASGASIKELPDEYIHFAHHDFSIEWSNKTNRQEVMRGIHTFFGGMGEGQTCETWQDALHLSLYDLYQVSDVLKDGDTFTATYQGQTRTFRCAGVHVLLDKD